MKNPKIDAKVDDLKNDKLSGSSILAHRAAECLDDFAAEILEKKRDMDPVLYLKELLLLGTRLVSSQPTMAAVLNGVNTIISSITDESKKIDETIGSNKQKQLKYLCTSTQAAARKFVLDLKLAQQTIADSYSCIITNDDILMTISASGSVEKLITTAHENSMNISVYIPESRPMFEGRLLAQRLSERGIRCTLIADSAMFYFLDRCTKVLVGADRVIPNGIINKIGTSGLAVAAKDKKIPFYCVCECTKLAPDLVPMENLNPPQQEAQLYYITDDDQKPDKLKIENVYFDFTPSDLITKFLMDCGLMDSDQVKDYIAQVKILPELLASIK